MIGAIIGDVIGSVYEGNPLKTTEFPIFSSKSDYTDDTVLTIATAYSILEGVDYASSFKRFGRKYTAGYGANFYNWLYSSSNEPYNSWGNGSAMRVSPIGFAFDSVNEVLNEAKRSAEVTHNHPEGIKGAQATALAIYLARMRESKERIVEKITDCFSYDLSRTLDEIRPTYHFKISCQESVPESIIAFIESTTFEGAIRNAISLGGDSDTMACISGGIAQAFYQTIPEEIVSEAKNRIQEELLEIVDRFNRKFNITY
ncbi:ADP-ribosylglycohydrolase family protein [Thermodesulfobacteriota bacterium]